LEKIFAMPVRSDYLLRSQVHSSPQRLGSIGHPQDLSFLDGPWYYETDEERASRRESASGVWEKSYESDDTLENSSEVTVVAGDEEEGEEHKPEPSVHPARKYSVCRLLSRYKADTNRSLSYTSSSSP
jgi:hypothetical protein